MSAFDNNNLGKHIRRRRLQASLSQQQLAKILKVNPATISRFEVGLRLPTLHKLEKLSKALNCSLIVELQKKIN